MNEYHLRNSDGAEEHDGTPEGARLLRRGLVGGAIAAAAAVALERARPAAAVDGDNVRAGLTTTATSTTILTNTTPTSATGLRVNATAASYGTAVEANGSAYGVWGIGGDYAGVFGDSTDAWGVSALSRGDGGQVGGLAAHGSSTRGVGALGTSPNVGVAGIASLFGSSDWPEGSPIGVYAAAPEPGGIGAVLTGGRAALRLLPADTAGAPATGAHEVGEVVVDSTGKVFVCTTAGTPGLWNELGAAVTPATPRPTLQLLPTPERFVDTRLALGGVQGVVPAGTTNTFALTGRLGQAANPQLQIPDTATAIVGNLTVIGAPGTPGAYLTLWPGGDMPTVSNINYGPHSVGDAIANSFTVGLADTGGGQRGVKLFNFGQCDYIIDVTGYYVLA